MCASKDPHFAPPVVEGLLRFLVAAALSLLTRVFFLETFLVYLLLGVFRRRRLAIGTNAAVNVREETLEGNVDFFDESVTRNFYEGNRKVTS